MNIKSTALAIILFALSINANAALINNGTYTTDSATGLDWLDLSLTNSMSYDQVSSQFGVGGLFEGYRYATVAELDAFGSGASLATIDDLWASSAGAILFFTADFTGSGNVVVGYYDLAQALFNPSQTSYPSGAATSSLASALVSVSAVPLPAAVWLFGSGLIGLVGAARRKAGD